MRCACVITFVGWGQEEVVVMCEVAEISSRESARLSVGVDFNGAEGGTFDISSPGEHTFTLPSRSPGAYELLLSLFLDGELLAEQASSFACSGESEPEAPGDLGTGSVGVAEERHPPPPPAPRAPWRLAVESPTSCQVSFPPVDASSLSLMRTKLARIIHLPGADRAG